MKVNTIFRITIVAWVVLLVLTFCSTVAPDKLWGQTNYIQYDRNNLVSAQIYLASKFDLDIPEDAVALNVESEPEPVPEPVYPLSDYERWYVECIVCGEAGNEPYWGKVAVASCILNACIRDNIRPEEVRTKYGYAGWYDINQYEQDCLNAYGKTTLADEVREVVAQVFDDGEVYSRNVLWFYNPDNGYSSFHEGQTYIGTIGSHKLFAPN